MTSEDHNSRILTSEATFTGDTTETSIEIETTNLSIFAQKNMTDPKFHVSM